jgi:hypothetical protein
MDFRIEGAAGPEAVEKKSLGCSPDWPDDNRIFYYKNPFNLFILKQIK